MVADINLETTTLKVSGPQSVVEQISYAGGEIDVTGATSNQSISAKPQFYDVERNVLDSSRVTIENSTWAHRLRDTRSQAGWSGILPPY